jgi:hypothetical protein
MSFCPDHKEALELSDEMTAEGFVHWALVALSYKCDCGGCENDRRMIAEMASSIFRHEIMNKMGE